MTEVTPEHVQMLVQGATPTQIVTMVFLGIIAMGVIIGVVKWVVDTKVASLPQDINDIKNGLADTNLKLTEVKGKLWSHDDVAREIAHAVNGHALNCPARNNNAPNRGRKQEN